MSIVNSSSEIYCVSEAKRRDGVVTSTTKNGLYKYPAFHLCLVATMASLRVYRDYVIKIFFKIKTFAVAVQRTFTGNIDYPARSPGILDSHESFSVRLP